MDAFFERVMFPITDLAGRVIGFGGRILSGEGAKYKNTAETPLFVKRHVLFGLDQAKEAMRARNQAILVEGYMDVIMPHQAGIRNVVAPLGTALTDEQARIIRQQAQQVIVAFDMDTRRSDGHPARPAEAVRQRLRRPGARAPGGEGPGRVHPHPWRGCVRRTNRTGCSADRVPAQSGASATGRPTPEEMAKAVESVAQVLADVRNEVLREAYVDQVADRLAGDNPLAKPDLKLAIDRQMNRLLRRGFQHNLPDSRNNRRGPGEPASPGPTSIARPMRRSRRRRGRGGLSGRSCICCWNTLDCSASSSRPWERRPSRIPTTSRSTLRGGVFWREGDPLTGGDVIARLLDRLSDPEARRVLTEMAAKPMLTTDPEKEAADCIEKITKHRDSRRLEDLENQIKAAASAKQRVDPAIWNEYMALVRKLKSSRS